ncbi:MAG TPA: glycoside hydrolase family 2 TIM barrel-domain containing protein [Polyangia bacterium]|nr:glycoside hydrolase family 2 TIM barrel-domain containing protein [Polyangia bacterium]
MGRATNCCFSALALFFAAPSVASAKAPLRHVVSLDDGWRFLRADAPGAEAPGFDDRKWARVAVPHTWNAKDGQDGGGDYYRGVGWYRRHVAIPKAESGRELYVELDGANLETTLYVNGHEVGHHAGGTARFRFDVTSVVTPGGPNVLAVKVTNAPNPNVPPRSADYTFFGGIYRDVRLVSVDPVHLDMDSFGSSGVLAFQQNVTKESATVSVRASVSNADPAARDADVAVSVRVPTGPDAGRIVSRASAHLPIPARGTHEATLALPIASPHLWDGVRDPYLYALDVEVTTGGRVVDAVTEPLGLRRIDFDAGAGFALNGAPLDLHGVNRHQDRQDKGWAISPRDQDEDMAILRELGANAVRLAHYQHSQYFYDLCDKYGLVVWAEIPVINSAGAGPFVDNAKQQLAELIRQSGNHPSIVTWSVANELQHDKSDAGALVPLVSALNEVAHREDPSRPTTLATFYAATDPSASITDLVGFNRYDGWYVNTIEAFPPGLDVMRARRPQLRMAISEYGAGASVSIHAATPKKMDHSEEYQALFHEAYWQALAARPWIWGSFVWNLFDFASDGRKEGDHAGRNDKGLVTYDRKIKKDAFYWFKANWSSRPFVYVTGRRFSPRAAGATDLKVYSNAAKVALRVNGKALPEQRAPTHVFVWPGVALKEGGNVVEATAVVDGHTVRDRITIVGR